MTTDSNPSRPIIEVVILTFNSGAAAVQCIESVRAGSTSVFRLQVVDNASDDNTVSQVERAFPDLEVVVSPKNLGFGGGCNLGIEAARERGADYVLLVNPDSVIAPDMVDVLVDFMEAHHEAGVVGAKTLSMEPMPDGRPRRLWAGSFRGRLPLRQRVPGIERADTDDPKDPVEVDYIWGHGMLLRLDALREVGGFDTDFFMYYEDLDLCRRLKRAGYGVWCEPAALMWHDAPDGSRALHSERWRWRFKAHSMAVFHRKHYGGVLGRGLSLCTSLAEAAQLLGQGNLRALRHQIESNLAHALGLARQPDRRA